MRNILIGSAIAILMTGWWLSKKEDKKDPIEKQNED